MVTALVEDLIFFTFGFLRLLLLLRWLPFADFGHTLVYRNATPFFIPIEPRLAVTTHFATKILWALHKISLVFTRFTAFCPAFQDFVLFGALIPNLDLNMFPDFWTFLVKQY